jgi:hypothetical protein
MTVTQPLRDEHKELIPHIEALRAVADSVGYGSIEAIRHGVDEAYTFLTHHLIPHAEAEDRALYPVVEKLMGTAGVTATMSRDHVEVGRLTQELSGLRAQLTTGGEVQSRRFGASSTGSTRWSRCTSPRRRRYTCPSWMDGSRRRPQARCSRRWKPLQRPQRHASAQRLRPRTPETMTARRCRQMRLLPRRCD